MYVTADLARATPTAFPAAAYIEHRHDGRRRATWEMTRLERECNAIIAGWRDSEATIDDTGIAELIGGLSEQDLHGCAG